MMLFAYGMVALANGLSAEPCCQTCEAGKEKFFSIPSQTDPNPQCGECCLEPSRYHFWKLFEPKLLKGDCASQGFTEYTSTETDGVWPLSVTNDRYMRKGYHKQKAVCPQHFQSVFADMHDGDKKEVTVSGTSMIIKPSGNDQTWVVKTALDRKSCSAIIDFNVPGKPGPPPVNLTATFWESFGQEGHKSEFEFTDPSGTLAPKVFPLNRWVELEQDLTPEPVRCRPALRAVYADMHDGDKKEVTVSGTSVVIKPSGNNQTWVVKTVLDPTTCSAKVDFNVTGKPNPPPVALKAAFWYSMAATTNKLELEFTDPSGKLAPKDFPLNHWVELSGAGTEIVI